MGDSIVGSGKYTYEVIEDWAKLPEGWAMPAAAVTVDSQDRVYCFNRTPDHPVVVFDRDGNYLDSWGAGFFAFPHTIRADEHDNLWIVDRDGQPFHSPDADAAFRVALKQHLDPRIPVRELDLHINDEAFADAAAEALLELIPARAQP